VATTSTLSRRTSEFAGVALFAISLIWLIALVTHEPADPVWFFTAGDSHPAANFVGLVGAFISEVSLQVLGYASFLVPAVAAVAGWSLFWCRTMDSAYTKSFGAGMFLGCLSALFELIVGNAEVNGRTFRAGGYIGEWIADACTAYLNRPGAIIVVLTLLALSVIMATQFSFGRTFAALFEAFTATGSRLITQFQSWLRCVAPGPGQPCGRAGQDSAHAYVRGVYLRTEDRATPQLAVTGGSLFDGEVVRGTRGLTFAGIRGLAARAAHDVSMYDQDGCLSPHAFYVERRGQVSPEKFGEALAAALEEASKDLPPVVAEQEEAAGVQLARAQARFESAGIATVTRVLESPGSTAWTVIVDDRARFEPGPTRRTIRVHAVDGPDEVARVLAPSARSIEALGLEARGPERVKLEARFADLGIPRIAPIGSLQNPVPWDTHGGVPRLLPFVTWTTVEQATGTSVGSRTPGAIRRRLGAAGIRRR